MPFKKGKSGNPGGFSKDEAQYRAEFKAAIDKAMGGPQGLVKKLLEFLDFASDHSIKLAALKMLMEYRLGKPHQQIEVEGGDKPIKFVIMTGVPESEKKPDAGRTAD